MLKISHVSPFILCVLALCLTSCKHTTAVIFTQDFSTVTSQVCLKINDGRPALLEKNSDFIISKAKARHWTPEKTKLTLEWLYSEDEKLRQYVSPIGDGANDIQCKRASVHLHSLAHEKMPWSALETEEYKTAIASIIKLMRNINYTLTKQHSSINEQLENEPLLLDMYGKLLEYGKSVEIGDIEFIRKSKGFRE